MTPEIASEIVKVLHEFGTGFAVQMNQSMTADEAAAFLKVSRNELLRYTKFGLAYFRRGKRYTFTMADLISFRDNFKHVVTRN